jgi:hypothetical protein
VQLTELLDPANVFWTAGDNQVLGPMKSATLAGSKAVTDEIQIQSFHLNQISGSSAEITISAKPH